MARSILGTVGLALTLAFAIPVAFLGVDYLLSGRTNQGLLFLGIAVLMVAIEEYVTTPTDIPGMVAGRVLGGAVKEPDGEAATAGEATDGPDTGPGGPEQPVPGPSETGDSDGADDPTDAEIRIPDAEEDRRD
jgi:hypothetical protein